MLRLLDAVFFRVEDRDLAAEVFFLAGALRALDRVDLLRVVDDFLVVFFAILVEPSERLLNAFGL